MLGIALAGCVPVPDANPFDPAADNDSDGVVNGEDCAPEDANIGDAVAGFTDADGDGWGGAATAACDAVQTSGDCDDDEPSVNPDAYDACGDDVDQNCDSGIEACRWDGDLSADVSVFTVETPNPRVSAAPFFLQDPAAPEYGKSAIATPTAIISVSRQPNGDPVGEVWDVTLPEDAVSAVVAGIGNVTRSDFDNFDELAFGVQRSMGRSTVYIVPGFASQGFTIENVATRLQGPDNVDFGVSIAGLGLANGDPLDDFAVGAPGDADGQGCVYVFAGSSAWVTGEFGSDDAIELVCGDSVSRRFGEAVHAAGDLDADGERDLVVSGGAAVEDIGYRLHFVTSRGDVLGTIYQGLDLENGDGPARPLDVAALGDLSGDGQDDVLIAASGISADSPGYFGLIEHAPTGPEDVYVEDALSTLTYGPSKSFAANVEALGDYDWDGYPDFAVTAAEARFDYADDAGLVFVFSGDVYRSTLPDEFGATPWTCYSASFAATDGLGFGASLAGTGDLDGDYWPDLAVADSTSVHVFLGGVR